MDFLKISPPNAKIDYFSLSLLSGWSCPFADKCKSKVGVKNGKRFFIEEKGIEFRCFSATQEQRYPKTYESRKRNFDLITSQKSVEDMATLILASLPVDIKHNIFRIHVAGDFFNEMYFKSWMEVAIIRNDVIFYGYTKSISFLVKYKNEMPKNFRIVASKGGRMDHLIDQYNLVYAEVVMSKEEAREKGLKIDHDDSMAVNCNENFALLLHGTQPKGTEAAKQLSLLRKKGIGGYDKKNKKIKIKNGLNTLH